MKKFVSITLVVLLVLSIAAGCSQQQTAADYVVLAEDFGEEDFAIGFRKADIALAAEVQRQLDTMIADGTAAEIATRWFDADIYYADSEYIHDLSVVAPEDNSLETVMTKGELVLGLDVGFKPMGYYDEQGAIVGFDIDLATEVCERMGIKLVLQPITWAAKEMELNSNKIDCIWNGMSVTPERIENLTFSRPYLKNRQIAIVKGDSGIATKADMSGKVAGLQEGSTARDALDKDVATATSLNSIVEYPDNVAVFMDLKNGRIDIFVVDEVVGRALIENESAAD